MAKMPPMTEMAMESGSLGRRGLSGGSAELGVWRPPLDTRRVAGDWRFRTSSAEPTRGPRLRYSHNSRPLPDGKIHPSFRQGKTQP